jgi:hypothetical protein
VLHGRHFAVMAGFEKGKEKEKEKRTGAHCGAMRTPQTPFFRLYFFAPLCSLGALVPPGVLFSAGGATEGIEYRVPCTQGPPREGPPVLQAKGAHGYRQAER